MANPAADVLVRDANAVVIGDGGKFGATWALYDGDPLAVHSHALVYMHTEGEKIRPSDLTGMNRVAASVKKDAYLGECNDQTAAALRLTKIERSDSAREPT